MTHIIYSTTVDRSTVEHSVQALRAASRVPPAAGMTTSDRAWYEFGYIEGRRDERRLWLRKLKALVGRG